jgi:hypothetical protein
MDATVDVIEIIGNRYVLNNQNLCSALTSAQECNRIALISIIGPQSSGKKFFIECLRNYLTSDERDKWPQSNSTIIKMSQEFGSGRHNRYPTIRLSSSPFIIEEEMNDKINKIAIFLMDSDMVFDHEMALKQVEDIMALFLLTSSTVIYNHKNFLPVNNVLSSK